MPDEKNTKSRTKEERVMMIDAKINRYKENIQKLELKKQNLLNPKKSEKALLKELINQLNDRGMSVEEIKEKIGCI